MTTAFVSYGWDSESHRTWVRELSTKMRADGVETILDQWHAVAGDNLPQFMESAIRENDHVIVVCTPAYKRKSDDRLGGVGYEGDIMTGEAYVLKNRRKFIPVLRDGEWKQAAPSWLLGTYYIDLRGPDWSSNYRLLIDTICRRLPQAPPVHAQGFKFLRDKSVLDTTTGLVWANCRSPDCVALEDVRPMLEAHAQATSWIWRLPTQSEIEKVKKAEEYYPRPPIMVSLQFHHPFFGNYKKEPWTSERIANVRRDDPGNSRDGFHANSFFGIGSGLASILNVDAAHVAVEANSLRREFLLRIVREATPEDQASVLAADDSE